MSVTEVLHLSEHLHGLFWTHSNRSMSFPCQEPQRWRQHCRWGSHRAEGQNGTAGQNHLPDLPVLLGSAQEPAAFWAGSTHGQDTFSVLFSTSSKVDPEMHLMVGMRTPHKGSDGKQCEPSLTVLDMSHQEQGWVPCAVSHLWRFFVGFTVEGAYPSTFQVFVISWRRLAGFPLELSTVTGFMGHFLLWWLVLGLCFYRFHGLDIYPGSELISEDRKGKGFRN